MTKKVVVGLICVALIFAGLGLLMLPGLTKGLRTQVAGGLANAQVLPQSTLVIVLPGATQEVVILPNGDARPGNIVTGVIGGLIGNTDAATQVALGTPMSLEATATPAPDFTPVVQMTATPVVRYVTMTPEPQVLAGPPGDPNRPTAEILIPVYPDKVPDPQLGVDWWTEPGTGRLYRMYVDSAGAYQKEYAEDLTPTAVIPTPAPDEWRKVKLADNRECIVATQRTTGALVRSCWDALNPTFGEAFYPQLAKMLQDGAVTGDPHNVADEVR